jgi:hypothetical protein
MKLLTPLLRRVVARTTQRLCESLWLLAAFLGLEFLHSSRQTTAARTAWTNASSLRSPDNPRLKRRRQQPKLPLSIRRLRNGSEQSYRLVCEVTSNAKAVRKPEVLRQRSG